MLDMSRDLNAILILRIARLRLRRGMGGCPRIEKLSFSTTGL
jgi:hypothetical protein